LRLYDLRATSFLLNELNSSVNNKYKEKLYCEYKTLLTGSALNEFFWAAVVALDYIGTLTSICLGAKFNEPMNENGDTPLHEAVSRADRPMMELLLKNGAEVNIVNNQKLAPLHIASVAEDPITVGLLIVRGGSSQITLKDSNGKTSLDIAKEKHGEESAIYSLLDQAQHKVDRKFRERVFQTGIGDLKQAQAKSHGVKRSSALYRLKPLSKRPDIPTSDSFSSLPLPTSTPTSTSRSSPSTPTLLEAESSKSGDV